MTTETGNPSNEKLDRLRKREQALRADIAKENHRQQRRRDREQSKLVATIGEALLRYAGTTPDFDLMLRGVVRIAVTDERSRKFLKDMGWL